MERRSPFKAATAGGRPGHPDEAKLPAQGSDTVAVGTPPLLRDSGRRHSSSEFRGEQLGLLHDEQHSSVLPVRRVLVFDQ